MLTRITRILIFYGKCYFMEIENINSHLMRIFYKHKENDNNINFLFIPYYIILRNFIIFSF